MKNRVTNIIETGGYRYEERQVYCNKKTCTRCPHGPYWYLIIKLKDGKKVTKYLGKKLPEGIQAIRVVL